MSDQMPDEVWVDEHDVAWNAGDGLIPGDAVRYIRADLYEQVVRKRGALREALEEIRDWPEDWPRGDWDMAQSFQRIAEEALDHE